MACGCLGQSGNGCPGSCACYDDNQAGGVAGLGRLGLQDLWFAGSGRDIRRVWGVG